ncbi:MAG: hypothetical protein MI923_28730 [Phycisphaerales bacterium]|nr:hypothetical protein [Phycisphaerales bacterium]
MRLGWRVGRDCGRSDRFLVILKALRHLPNQHRRRPPSWDPAAVRVS